MIPPMKRASRPTLASRTPSPLAAAAFALLGSLTFAGCSLDPVGTAPAGTTSSASSSGSGGSGVSTASSGGAGGSGNMGGSGGVGGLGGGGGAGGGCVDDGTGICEPWWNDNFSSRRRIVLDTTGVTDPLTDFPWLVKFDETTVDYSATQNGGDDLRFVMIDAVGNPTVLSRDVEQWAKSGTSSVWVRIPMIPADGSPVTIWMYHGNPNANAPPAEDRRATWNTGFVSVHHFHGNENDATAGGHDGTSPNTGSTPAEVAGRIANCRDFDGQNDHILLPLATESDYDFDKNLAVSAWISVSGFTSNWQAVVAKGDNSWRLHRNDGANSIGFGSSATGQPSHNLSGTSDVAAGAAWHHVAMTYDGAKKTIYVDGILENSLDYTFSLVNSEYQVCIGENLQSTDRFFFGKIDEVRISSVSRSASWISLEHRNVVNDALTTIGAEQKRP
jgi:hypothetical protein